MWMPLLNFGQYSCIFVVDGEASFLGPTGLYTFDCSVHTVRLY